MATELDVVTLVSHSKSDNNPQKTLPAEKTVLCHQRRKSDQLLRPCPVSVQRFSLFRVQAGLHLHHVSVTQLCAASEASNKVSQLSKVKKRGHDWERHANSSLQKMNFTHIVCGFASLGRFIKDIINGTLDALVHRAATNSFSFSLQHVTNTNNSRLTATLRGHSPFCPFKTLDLTIKLDTWIKWPPGIDMKAAQRCMKPKKARSLGIKPPGPRSERTRDLC